MAFHALLGPAATGTILDVVIKDDGRQYLTDGQELHVPAYTELTRPLRTALALLRPHRTTHPIHDTEFVHGWYRCVRLDNADRLSLCRHCGDELQWLSNPNVYGNAYGETHCVPGRPQHHEPLPHPRREVGA